MEPILHTTILPRKDPIWIELSAHQNIHDMDTLRLDPHNMFVLLF